MKCEAVYLKVKDDGSATMLVDGPEEAWLHHGSPASVLEHCRRMAHGLDCSCYIQVGNTLMDLMVERSLDFESIFDPKPEDDDLTSHRLYKINGAPTVPDLNQFTLVHTLTITHPDTTDSHSIWRDWVTHPLKAMCREGAHRLRREGRHKNA